MESIETRFTSETCQNVCYRGLIDWGLMALSAFVAVKK